MPNGAYKLLRIVPRDNGLTSQAHYHSGRTARATRKFTSQMEASAYMRSRFAPTPGGLYGRHCFCQKAISFVWLACDSHVRSKAAPTFAQGFWSRYLRWGGICNPPR